jgi:hypothetical protein
LYRYNTEGLAVGGPTKKNKIFYFFSTEHYQQLVPGGTSSYYTPTSLEREGDFSQSINSLGQPLTIYQPGTATPFPGNKLPSGSLNAGILALMKLYPMANVSGYGTVIRLRKWISQASLPPRTAYSVHLSPDRNRLWLQLIHTGFPVDQLRKWDRGEDWPCWDEVIQEIPEIATARTSPDLQTGFPFKYLRRVSD